MNTETELTPIPPVRLPASGEGIQDQEDYDQPDPKLVSPLTESKPAISAEDVQAALRKSCEKTNHQKSGGGYEAPR